MAAVVDISNLMKQINDANPENPDPNVMKNVYLSIVIHQKILMDFKEHQVSVMLQHDPNIVCIIGFDVVNAFTMRGKVYFSGINESNLQYDVTLYYINSTNEIELSETINVPHMPIDSVYYFKRNIRINRFLSVVDGNLYLCCKIAMKYISPVKIDIPKQESFTKCIFLYENNLMSDFKIICEDQEFYVNRAILAFRSPVFRAMLESSMREAKEHKLNIKDFKSTVVELMIRYIYSDEIRTDLSREELTDLYLIADKYDLENLKKLCSKNLCATAKNTTDIVNIIFFAGSLNLTEFKEEMIQFMNINKHILFEENILSEM